MKAREKMFEMAKKYPSLFMEKDKGKTESCMFWGVAVGPGWYDLLDRTCQQILEVDKDQEIYFSQIKEKWGGLRIYVNNGSDEVWDILNKAEEESYKICEECSKPGKLRQGGWLRTLCDECNEEREKETKERLKRWEEEKDQQEEKQ